MDESSGSARSTRIGTQIGGYRIESVIGRGGMSVIYLAEQVRLGRKVALKLLAPELATDDRYRERFAAESRLASSINHPNIIPLYGAGEDQGYLYIAMRYIDGPSLRQLMQRSGPLGRAWPTMLPPPALAAARPPRGRVRASGSTARASRAGGSTASSRPTPVIRRSSG